MSLTTFNTELNVRYIAKKIEDAEELSHENYIPAGCTAMYDAIGATILATDKAVKAMKKKPDKILFVVMTDGQENSSVE